MIVPGSASQELAAVLSAALDEPLAAVEYEPLAVGEPLVLDGRQRFVERRRQHGRQFLRGGAGDYHGRNCNGRR